MWAAAEADGLCHRCWGLIDRAPGWSCDTLVALGTYHGHLGRAVRAAKFRPDRPLLRALGRRLGVRVTRSWPASSPWLLLPLPSDPQRLRQRGIDHTADIAAGLSAELGPPAICAGGLVRSRRAPTQSTRGRHDRAHNVAFSMRWQGPPPPEHAALLLVDDVLTSGASAQEARRALATATPRTPRMAVLAASADRTIAPELYASEP
jgi:predicted amidophosphoribosyltransferase